MSGLIKYRVHEVAKDFGMTSKEITQILTDYATTPKNHMQVLEDDELNDIFEYLTQHHQAASLEELYKVPDQPKAKPQAAPAEMCIRDRDTHDAYQTTENHMVLEKVLHTLTDGERQIVMLHALSGLKHREIADLLGIPQATAISRYNRALAKLRNSMGGDDLDR